MREFVHANKYDSMSVWCEVDDPWSHGGIAGCDVPADGSELAEVTCVACLQAIVAYGERAAQALKVLREKGVQEP